MTCLNPVNLFNRNDQWELKDVHRNILTKEYNPRVGSLDPQIGNDARTKD